MNRKISNFFYENDALINTRFLNIHNSYGDSQVIDRNIMFTAARMDLIRYIINAELQICSWYRSVALQAKYGKEFSSFTRGLSVEFRVKGPAGSTGKAFDKLKDKILGINSVTISVHELIYFPDRDILLITFRPNMKERNKIGLKKANSHINWLVKDGKVIKKIGGSKCL